MSRYRGYDRGWRVWVDWFAAQCTVPFILLVFFVLNRTRVYGKARVPDATGTLLLSNHQSMIDSFLLVFTAYFPRELIRPHLLPWHPAAEENFFRTPILSWVFTALKCIPVRPGRRDLRAITRSTAALDGGNLILFPEGTRTRDGSIGHGRPGAGVVLLSTGATVLPVTITGIDAVLPIGRKLPRVGHRVSVYFGRPIDYADLMGDEPTREQAQKVVTRVMDRIRFQRRVIERLDRRA